MINVIKQEINTIFKRYGYPELFAKIGIDAGENAIVQYGYEQLSPVDILGYSMNIAANQYYEIQLYFEVKIDEFQTVSSSNLGAGIIVVVVIIASMLRLNIDRNPFLIFFMVFKACI